MIKIWLPLNPQLEILGYSLTMITLSALASLISSSRFFPLYSIFCPIFAFPYLWGYFKRYCTIFMMSDVKVTVLKVGIMTICIVGIFELIIAYTLRIPSISRSTSTWKIHVLPLGLTQCLKFNVLTKQIYKIL